MRWRKPVSKVEREYVSVIAISGERSRKACATPLTILAAPGPRVERHIPGLPVRSPQVAANIAPATSCFIRRNRICRWRAASISSTDSPPGCPTMNGVPASLNAVASTSTVVVILEASRVSSRLQVTGFSGEANGGSELEDASGLLTSWDSHSRQRQLSASTAIALQCPGRGVPALTKFRSKWETRHERQHDGSA